MADATDAAELTRADASAGDARVKELQAELEAVRGRNAELAAYKNTVEAGQRARLAELKPQVAAFVDDVIKTAGDHAREIEPMREWSQKLENVENVEATLPLTRLISCASAQLKRSRDEASVVDEKTRQLAAANGALEAAEKKLRESQLRGDELARRCEELVAANEAFATKVEEYGLANNQKQNFSQLSTRLKPDAAGASSSHAGGASGAPAAFKADALMSFITSTARPGSATIMPSSTNHATLGGGASREAEFAAAGRV